MGRPSTKIKRECLNCGIEFFVKPSRSHKDKCHNRECSIEYRKKNGVSDETRRKISQTKGGIKKEKRICISPECGIEFEVPKYSKKIYHSRECSCRTIGKRSHNNIWNKGLPPDDPRVIAKCKKQSEALKKSYESGEISPWNKGLTVQTDSRMAAMNEKLTLMRNTDGEWKEKWRESMRKGQVEARANGSYDHCAENTKPELLTKTYLESLGFIVKHYKDRSSDDPPKVWYQQYPFEESFNPDFACPDLKSIIEVDGCYVHDHDINKCVFGDKRRSDFSKRNAKRDKRKHWLYHQKGWRWANVWECEARCGDFHRIEKYILDSTI